MSLRRPRLQRSALYVPILVVLGAGCGGPEKSTKNVRQMGERVEVGRLVYNILEADWVNQLQQGSSTRIPRGKFLIVRLSVTNSGNQEVSLPSLSLENSSGESFMELSEVEGVEEPLGILRNVAPAETLQGRIMFDVAPVNYTIRLTDGDPDNEKTAYVEIPLRLSEAGPLSVQR